MKPDEIKLKAKNYINDLIDDVFPNTELFNRLKSATAKFWVEQNLWRLDAILNQFVDQDGDINAESAFQIYSQSIFDEQGRFCVDIRNVINNESVSRYLPNSMVVFTKDDLKSILCC